MRKNLRVLALCLFGGMLASMGWIGTQAIADSFTDVPGGSFFADDIDWLTDYDIANGFPNGTFDPNGPIKRQQAALWMRNLSSEFEIVTNTTDPASGSVFSATVDCPGDKRVLAGSGNQSQVDDLFQTDSRASDSNTWFVRWETDNDAIQDPTSLTITALCGPRL